MINFLVEFLLHNTGSIMFRGASTASLFAVRISCFYTAVQMALGQTFLLCLLGTTTFLSHYCDWNNVNIVPLISLASAVCYHIYFCIFLTRYQLPWLLFLSAWFAVQSLLSRYGAQCLENLIVALLVNVFIPRT